MYEDANCSKRVAAACDERPMVITYGCELEWSDIDRSIDIPEDLGSWEGPKIAGRYMGSEIDIVNTKGQWWGAAVDPLAITCPVGGEIHTVPSPSIQSQFCRILRLMDIFPKLGVACPNHGHIHVGIPELKTNLELLKNFFKYLERNENYIIANCSGFDEDEHDKVVRADLPEWAKKYFIIGDAKHINPELYQAIEASETIEEAMHYIRTIECLDWDWCTQEFYETGGSHRTAVNMFNLTKGNTIEFRVFRASLNPVEIWSCLSFVQEVVCEALKGEKGMSVPEIIQVRRYQFPKLNFDEKLAQSWVESRHRKGRCGPFKKSFSSADIITEDPIILQEEISASDSGIASILAMCTIYVDGRDPFQEITSRDLKPICEDVIDVTPVKDLGLAPRPTVEKAIPSRG